MSINKLVSILNPITDAIDMLALDHDKFRPMFTSWATYAEKEIGGQCTIKKYAVLDICGCTAELPCDAFKIKGALMGSHDANCSTRFGGYFNSGSFSALSSNHQFLVVDVGDSPNSTNCSFVDYEIQDNKIVFGSHTHQTHITIMYEGFATDCDGFIKVGENHVEAISTYIQYKYWMRKQKKTSADMQMMQFAYREWDRLCAHSRALDNELTDSQREEIAQLYHDPYSGRGLSVGMVINGNDGWYNY